MRGEWITHEKIGERYLRVFHESGLQILIYPKPAFHGVFAIFGTKFGSIDCAFSRGGEILRCPAGTAHFLEHKLFEGEEGSAFERYAKTGASANAYTSFDKTCYLFSCTDHAEESLRILLSFVTAPYFTKETVEKELGIIGQEIRMYDDDPNWRVMFNLLESAYHIHPVRLDIAGSAESIAEITPETLYEFYGKYYNLRNMTLCVAGRIDPETVLSVADELLKPAPEYENTTVFEPEEDTIRTSLVRQKLSVSLPLFELGFKERVPNGGRVPISEIAAADVLLSMLASDFSPLFRRLLDRGLINESSFGSEFFEGRGFAMTIFSGESRDAQRVAEEIRNEIETMRREGFSQERFLRSRKALYGKNVAYLNSAESIGSSLSALSLAGCGLFEYIDAIAAVTPEDITRRLAETMRESHSVLSIIDPID